MPLDDHPRVLGRTKVKGVFGLPMGVRFLQREIGDFPKMVEVSTVCLDGGHLEDPLRITAPESGFETMVFLDGCSFFSLFTQQYKTRRAALRGHKAVVDKLLAQELPLAIRLGYYHAWDTDEPDRVREILEQTEQELGPALKRLAKKVVPSCPSEHAAMNASGT